MKIIFYIVIFLFSSNITAQSIYLNSKKTSFSLSPGVATNKNALVYGISSSATLKGTTNFAISYGKSKIHNTDNDEPKTFTGQSLQIYIGFMIANELDEMNKIGIEFGFVGQNNWNEYGIPTANLFGINLGLSKRVHDEESHKLKHVLKLGINAFPIVLIQENNNYAGTNKHIVGESFAVFNPSIAFVFDMSKTSKLVLEPMISFDTENTPAVFSITAHLVL